MGLHWKLLQQPKFEASFEASTAVMFEVVVFWIVTPCWRCHNTTRSHNPEDHDFETNFDFDSC
jgi:uncharacterized protein YcbX